MNLDFEDEWDGWRLRGRHLVSEDGQRMRIERPHGLMWRDKMELRLKGYASGAAAEGRKSASCQQLIKVVVVQLAAVRHRGATAS